MNDFITILHESKLIKVDISDHASMQFENFCKLASSTRKNEFKEFGICRHRLDTFLFSVIIIKESEFDSFF